MCKSHQVGSELCNLSAVLMKDLKLNLTSSAVAAASILIF